MSTPKTSPKNKSTKSSPKTRKVSPTCAPTHMLLTPAATKPKVKSKKSVPPASGQTVSLRSYFLWEQAGRPVGRDVEFWLQAEKELAAN